MAVPTESGFYWLQHWGTRREVVQVDVIPCDPPVVSFRAPGERDFTALPGCECCGTAEQLDGAQWGERLECPFPPTKASQHENHHGGDGNVPSVSHWQPPNPDCLEDYDVLGQNQRWNQDKPHYCYSPKVHNPEAWGNCELTCGYEGIHVLSVGILSRGPILIGTAGCIHRENFGCNQYQVLESEPA